MRYTFRLGHHTISNNGRRHELSCGGAMDVIQKVADIDEPFEVLIRYGDTEAIFGCDRQVDFGERVQAELLEAQVAGDLAPLNSQDFFEEFGERRLNFN